MAEKVVVAGLGQFGRVLVQSLTQAGHDVLGVDRRQEPVRDLADTISKAVQGDATSLALWSDLPVKDVNIGIVAFSSTVEANVLTAVVLRKLGLKRIIARSSGDTHTELLRAIGVDVIVESSKDSALRLAHTLGSKIVDYLEVTGEFGVARINWKAQQKGLTVGRLHDQKKVTTLVIRRSDHVVLQPGDDDEVKAGDVLICAGKDEELRALADG